MIIANWVNLVEAFIASFTFAIIVVPLWFRLHMLRTNLISRMYSELQKLNGPS
jgi:hypothetical protein